MSIEQDAVALSCFALNTFGDGKHPKATPYNIQHFGDAYVRDCFTKLIKHPDTTPANKALAGTLLKLMPKQAPSKP